MDDPVDVSAMAINVTVPEALRWTATRKENEYVLQTLNVRLRADGRLVAKAYGRPATGGRGNAYAAFPVPDRPEIGELVRAAADRAAHLWAAAAAGA